ncbi:MAG: hypothetical protein ACOCY1_00055, partial [Halovenus sp.]
MEAAIRTAYELYTGETLVGIEIEAIRGLEGIREGTLTIDNQEVRLAVANGLGNAAKLLERAKADPD